MFTDIALRVKSRFFRVNSWFSVNPLKPKPRIKTKKHEKELQKKAASLAAIFHLNHVKIMIF